MASNYEKIREENRRRYGTEGAQKSGGLAASLYDNRAHFIFELLQNAEDALGRRGNWQGSRKVTFALSPACLTLSHFGKPFDEADVRSICDIAESTKNESAIGRFGLGFKSVYTVTDLPEIHSGNEHFAIEDYVFPKQVDPTTREVKETQINLPLKTEDKAALKDITEGFRRLGPSVLLFLRHIDEISWNVKGNATGFYLRNSPEMLGPNVQRITVIGQESGQAEIDQNWLVFHRDVFADDQHLVGRVEIAFHLVPSEATHESWSLQPLASSPLVVYFPTVVESHLGFLVQGPYRTTPSRDNIPPNDSWNQHLVNETAALLVEAMRWMRDTALLDVSALRCLPHDREKFPEGSRFAPMFETVKQAFQDEALLLAFDGNYVTANQAKLARTQELRELVSQEQVAALLGADDSAWLSGDITQDRAPEIRHYLMHELEIDEIRPEKLISSLTKSFLEAQTPEWVLRLYEFLSGQEKALRRHLDIIPLIRLNDGSHVVARENGKANAFLPSAIESGFPTIHSAVCSTPESRSFLASLGITEPDPVDDVIRNVLPRYSQDEIEIEDEAYAADIERIRLAFNTDSATQKEKLRAELRETNFVMVVDTGDNKTYIAKPDDIYIATDRLKQLFKGVPDVLMVDDTYDCLRGEDMRDMLVACGASRYLAPQSIPPDLGPVEKEQIRREAGLERASWAHPPEDFTIRGLTQMLEVLSNLDFDQARDRAGLLWSSLVDLEGRGSAAFEGSYKWGYAHETKTARFDADFVKSLNKVAWVPSANGELVRPALVIFETLGWKSNPFLLSKVSFKPPIIDQLAIAAGIEPAALDLLRKLGVTSVADLTALLNITELPNEAEQEALASTEPVAKESPEEDVYGDAKDLYGDGMPEIPPATPDPDGGDGATRNAGTNGTGSPRSGRQGDNGAHSGSGGQPASGRQSVGKSGKRAPGQSGGRPFISYVGAHPVDDAPDPDGLDQAERMRIEDAAIAQIIEIEPRLARTAAGNPGFDLFESGNAGNLIRWVEVKAMTGCLQDRPVGLSHTQFECARVHRGSVRNSVSIL